MLLAIAVGVGAALVALPHASFAAARAWAARQAARSPPGNADDASCSGKGSDGGGSLPLSGSGSLKGVASRVNGSCAPAAVPAEPPPLPPAALQQAPNRTQQAAREQPGGSNGAAGEAAEGLGDEEERLAALLAAQRAVERAVSLLQRR